MLPHVKVNTGIELSADVYHFLCCPAMSGNGKCVIIRAEKLSSSEISCVSE